MYRKALHFYLIYAYPDDDVQYYSKWGWLANKDYWEGIKKGFPFPTEACFGCHVSRNTKLRCSPVGFMFDTNDIGDSDEIIKEVKRIASEVEKDWYEYGVPIYMRNEMRL